MFLSNQIDWYHSIKLAERSLGTLFCWNIVVFTSNWHLYFRVTYSLIAAPEFHRFILKVRRTNHMNFEVPVGGSSTLGYFRQRGCWGPGQGWGLEDECECWPRETWRTGAASQTISGRLPRRCRRLAKPAGVSRAERWEAAPQPYLINHSPERKIPNQCGGDVQGLHHCWQHQTGCLLWEEHSGSGIKKLNIVLIYILVIWSAGNGGVWDLGECQ